MHFPTLRTLTLAVLAGSMLLTGCTTTGETDTAPNTSARVALDAEVNDTLNRLYKVAPDAREMVAKAAGVLVFPSVVGGSFVVGGGYGRGAMLVDGRTQGYYSLGTGSIGWQIGAQSKSVIYVFNTREALAKFLDSTGWVAGVDASQAACGRFRHEQCRARSRRVAAGHEDFAYQPLSVLFVFPLSKGV